MDSEEARLNSLNQLEILGTGAEASFDHLTALAARLFRVPIALISFVGRERQWFKSHHGLNICETSRDVSFCVHAVNAARMLVVPDAMQDARFANNPLVTGEPNIRFYAGTPLHAPDGYVVGTLCLIDVVPRAFSDRDKEVLSDMGALVMDELELRLSRKQLQTQEQHWRALITGTSDIITVLNARGEIQYQSPAITTVLGYTPGELVGRSVFEFLHPDDLALISNAFRQVVEDPSRERIVEFRFRHHDGSWRYLEAIGKSCLADASVEGVIVTSRDITERKQIQERLRLLESVVINTNDTVIVTEAGGIDEPNPRIIYVNEAFTKMTGYTAEEAVGRSPRFLQGPLTQRPPLDELRRAQETHQPAKIQVINYHKDGSVFWVEMSIAPVFDETGRITHWISIQHDITQSKLAEEALRQAHEEAQMSNEALRERGAQLQLALESGRMGTWERDYMTNHVQWSTQTEALYGFEPGTFKSSVGEILERVHVEDHEQLMRRVQSQRTTNEFVDEFRVVLPDGSLRWLESRGRLLKDEDGQAKGTVGVVLDVTERKLDLEGAQLETLKRLALAAEYRDDDTGLHTQRVGRLSQAVAQAMGLPQPLVQLIGETAPLHDVGKIGVSDSILLKPGKLTQDEFALMKRHTAIGAGMLSESTSLWLQMAEVIASTHHERWDGTGYNNLKGEEIPLVGQIVCVADVFDALTHERPYKNAWPIEEAVAEIEAQSGRQFSPRVVEAFLTLRHEDYL